MSGALGDIEVVKCSRAQLTHQLLSHDLTNVIYEVVTVQGGGR